MRRGMAIYLAFGALLLLGFFAGIASFLSSSGGREVDVLNGHLRAVAVGESAFAQVVARLTSAPWCRRWFKDRPDVQMDVVLGDGTYDLMIRDAPGKNPALDGNQVDLLVLATWRASAVSMFWRITVPEDTLEEFRRAVPTVFTFAPDGSRANPATMDEMAQQVEQLIATRQQNTTTFGQTWPPDNSDVPPAQIATFLGVTTRGPVLDPAPGVPADGPPDLPSELAPQPSPPAQDLRGVRIYYSGTPAPAPVDIRGTREGSMVRYPLVSKMVTYRPEKQILIELLIPELSKIQAASIEVSAYNDDPTANRGVMFFVDGQGGGLGATTDAPGHFVGGAVLRPRLSGNWKHDLSSLVVADRNTLGNQTISVLDLVRKPGGCVIETYLTANGAAGPNTWISLDLLVRGMEP